MTVLKLGPEDSPMSAPAGFQTHAVFNQSPPFTDVNLYDLDRPLRDAVQANGAAPVVKYWVCKTAPAFIYEAMECLGGNGYVEESVLPRLYREAPVNAIWEGSGNVMCLDALRALAREPEESHAVLAALAQDGAQLPGVGETIAAIEQAVAGAESEAHARSAVERIALLAGAAALATGAPGRIATAFAEARLGLPHGRMFGTVGLAPDVVAALHARALPV